MTELKVATAVCTALAWFSTADTQYELQADTKNVRDALEVWREARLHPPMQWGRPVLRGPAISIPALGRPLSPELSSTRKPRAQHHAELWNSELANNLIFGPQSGYIVAVSERAANGRWPLVWGKLNERNSEPTDTEEAT